MPARRRQSRENKPRMLITADPRPQAPLAPPRPPGCPASKVPTGRRAAPDENIHDGACLKERRRPSIRLNRPGCCSRRRNKVKASEPGWRLRSPLDGVGVDGLLGLTRASRLIEQKLQAAFQEWRRCRITTFSAR